MSDDVRPLILHGTNPPPPPPPIYGVSNVVDMILQSPLLKEEYDFHYINLRKRSGTKFSERLSVQNLYYAAKQIMDLSYRLLSWFLQSAWAVKLLHTFMARDLIPIMMEHRYLNGELSSRFST